MTDMKAAYNMAAIAVRQRFAEQKPEYLTVLKAVTAKDVAVYMGTYDSIQEVLKCLSVPYAMNPAAESLTARIVFMNCGGGYNSEMVKNVGAHVETGAWLVTTDWALKSVIEVLYPEKVRWNKRSTADEVVAVEPGLNSLWSDVVVLGADPQWWLEGSSYAIEVVDTGNVRIEAASHDLLRKYNAPVVAVHFAAGRGQVYHLISHLWLKRTRTPGERYQGSCVDFLQTGMRLSEAGIDRVLSKAKVKPEDINFASLQSAATATELVAQLCVRAKMGKPFSVSSQPDFALDFAATNLAKAADDTIKVSAAAS